MKRLIFGPSEIGGRRAWYAAHPDLTTTLNTTVNYHERILPDSSAGFARDC